MERALYLTKFRNVGLEQSERIVLNNTLEKGKMGNLVILVGENNSGKSNVLDGIEQFGKNTITKRDVTTLSYEEKYSKPQLGLVCKDDKDEYTYRITYEEQPFVKYPKVKEKFIENKLEFARDISNFSEAIMSHVGNCEYTEKCNILLSMLNDKSPNLDQVENNFILMMKGYLAACASSYYYKRALESHVNSFPNSAISKYMGKPQDEKLILNRLFEKKYGIKFFPNISRYKEENISNANLKTSISSIDSNPFFVKVLNKIGITLKEIHNTYNAFSANNDKGSLKSLEKKLNKKMSTINDKFNDMYFADECQYRFEFSFETEYIYFILYKGDVSISLDYQSTGFKWFFNLYFNFLCDNKLSSGDIIIMDEPANNLHPYGIRELRKFLKDFAVYNDITIVIATHSPFLIDTNYLDELRLIVNEDNVSSIKNDFSSVDVDDPDSLNPVKRALTVEGYILLNPDTPIVFVEGITDYNYLLAFKKILNIKEDINFIPIQGIGDVKKKGYKEKQEVLIKKLLDVRKNNTMLLVDGDGAGKSIIDVNKKCHSDLDIVSLTEIDPNFKMIEYVFNENDANKIGIIKNGVPHKSSSKSALIKTFADDYKFSKTTLDNFKKIFDCILNR